MSVQPTPAETDALYRLAKPGATIATVARDLQITPGAVKGRLASLYRRLGVNNAVQAFAKLASTTRT